MTAAEPAEIGQEGFLGTDKYLGQMCVARQGAFLFGFAGLKEGADAKALTARWRRMFARRSARDRDNNEVWIHSLIESPR
jgi:hypothetical protein